MTTNNPKYTITGFGVGHATYDFNSEEIKKQLKEIIKIKVNNNVEKTKTNIL